LSKYLELLITKNHQVTVEITLSLQVENIDKSQKVQTFFPLISLQRE